ncbi:NAD-dependent succinate-semialdehyde dehydrogenase [Pusillimonas sp. DMV24BSW_D]|uniref:NAD-dependent succinate-semialdehyde dehydrogenase n=1 Tax=Neopusillimonas aestuarii TaxID=2716226 RepID=UPI0014086B13|nr:NAD-dependent succinate-semialdehyde dehydrogenase [Pusillimonas sp. DMV24BSW_D]QIM48473.1 NAD-dependent succinate-semialdehyde dehydrogenase [Pusillimonas sp. DMV24BSW_D]
MYTELSLYIDGHFIGADQRDCLDVVNPATEEVIGKLPTATTEDLDLALNAAHKAFQSWRRSSPLERSKILRKVAELTRERVDEIARNITLDMGKPLAEARTEVLNCAEQAEWHAEECRRIYGRTIPPRVEGVRQFVTKEPVGVCVAFTPWNFPYNQAIRKMVAALGAGCTLVLKGPEDAPSAVVALAQIFEDAGLPPGCLNIVWGNPPEVSQHLITSPIVRKVSFTGSVPVGKHLASLAGAHMKRITMELGGHSPVVVFDDADIDAAVALLVGLKMRNAGQVCIAPSRFYIQKPVYQSFIDKFSSAIADLRVGDGLDPATKMGPLAHRRRVEAMQHVVDDATKRGAQVVATQPANFEKGYFFSPTVLADVSDDADIMVNEPFGPVVPITHFDTIDDVLRRANSLPYGLASYVFTKSLKRASFMSTNLEAGMVNVNHFGIALAETPLGGVKDSGIGSEGGTETFDGYVVTKFVTEAC